MLQRITVNTSFMCIIMMLMLMMALVHGKVIEKPNSSQMYNSIVHPPNAENVVSNRQLEFLTGLGKETNTPNFIRLVVMRFVYGLASTMGVEERLDDLFNGAFVPPNADGDLFGFGGFGGGGGSDGGDFDALDGIFDDDGGF